MAKKCWNIMYVCGNPALFKQTTANADNPCARSEALQGAQHVANNGGNWRTWVEHKDTGERIFESDSEVAYRQAAENAAKPDAVACVTCAGRGNHPYSFADLTLDCAVCCGTGKTLAAPEVADTA